MSQPFTWSTQWSWNSSTPGLVWNGLIPNPNPVMPTTSTDTPFIVTLTPAQKAAILAKVAELAALITFRIGLSDEERKKLLKIGEKTAGWDQKTASYMAARPELIPAYVDTAILAQSRTARLDVDDILHAVGDVWQNLSDASMKLGNQIYKPELAFYNAAQEAAKHGVPGAQAIVDDLKTHLAKTASKTATPTTPTTP